MDEGNGQEVVDQWWEMVTTEEKIEPRGDESDLIRETGGNQDGAEDRTGRSELRSRSASQSG